MRAATRGKSAIKSWKGEICYPLLGESMLLRVLLQNGNNQ